MLADLIDNPDREIADRDAVLTLTVLVGAISIAWAINDPALCERVLTAAATSLKNHVQTHYDALAPPPRAAHRFAGRAARTGQHISNGI